jgi:hypothetical protein
LGIVPFLGASFGTRIKDFQWDRTPRKSNPSLTWYQKTRKPEVPEPENQKPEPVPEAAVQNFAGPVSRVRNWNFQKLTIPAYSPQSNASFGEFSFQIQEI